MDSRLLDRIFEELDESASKIEKLSEIVYANASVLGIVTKLTIGIIMFIIVISLTLFVNHEKTDIKNSNTTISDKDKK